MACFGKVGIVFVITPPGINSLLNYTAGPGRLEGAAREL